MPGLLDFLQTPEAQLGIGLLAAGGPTTDPNQTGFGQRLAGAMGSVTAQQQNAMKSKLLQSQIDENTSQNAIRAGTLARQAGMDAYYMGGAAPGAAAAPSGGLLAGPPTAGASPAGGAPAPGAVLKAAVGKSPTDPNPPQGKFAEWSKQYNIPIDSLVADYFSNGGKGIADMLFKAGRPDMQVAGNYAYDKNKVGAGYLPSLNISQDGKSSLVQIGPDGLPVVSAPQGATNTYAAYAGIGDRSKAAFSPGRPVIGADGRSYGQSQLAEVGGAPPPLIGPGAGAPGMTGRAGPTNAAERGMAADVAQVPYDLQREIQQTQEMLNTPGAMTNPQDRAQAQAWLASKLQPSRPMIGPGAGQPVAAVAPMAPAGATGALEFSPAEKAAQAAAQATVVDTAKADVARDTANRDQTKKGAQMQSAAADAMKLLDAGPTSSGIGSLADRGLNFVGQSSKGADVASQLQAIGGYLVANVPRMEGPQSDADVRNYQTMAGRVGDSTVPVSQRKAALATVVELQKKYAALNGVTASVPASPGAPASLPAGWTVKVK